MDTPHERRQSRRVRKSGSALLQHTFRLLHNNLPPLEMLDAEQVEQLHQASMEILETTGIVFMDDEALDLWSSAGAKVDKAKQRVRLERDLVMELVAKAPPAFTWRARQLGAEYPRGWERGCLCTQWWNGVCLQPGYGPATWRADGLCEFCQVIACLQCSQLQRR